MDIEAKAVSAVTDAISNTDRLKPFIKLADKEPVWDGYIAVYQTDKQYSVDTLLLRLPVQVKGKDNTKAKETGAGLSYEIKTLHLRLFLREPPTVFFVVRIDSEKQSSIFYKSFPRAEVQRVLGDTRENQKTVSLPFMSLPKKKDELEELFVKLAEDWIRESGGTAPASASYFPAPASVTDPFLYNAGIVGFYGREEQIRQLDAFLTSPASFRWWGVIGPGGAGKSRLGYEWGKQIREQGWTVRFLKAEDYKKLDALTGQNPGPLLLIADYARQHAAELGKWMETLCESERKDPLRLLLLERDEGADAVGETQWEKELYSAGNEVHLRRARHDRLLQLPALEDMPLLALIQAFAAALRERDTSLPELTEEDAETLLIKLGEIDEELRRPLYAMLLTDAFLRDPAAARWTREELLSRLVLREQEQVKNAVRALQPENTRLDEALFKAALRLRRLATALGASGDRELSELLARDADLGGIFDKKADQYKLPSVEELLLYLGLLRYAGGKLLVPALRPDLLGEYALLHWLTEDARQSEKQSFYAAALQDDELRTFFQRLYADYAPLLNAKPERWERLLPAGLELDDERASLYTHLLYDGFGRCTDRAQRGYLLKETARLADGIEAETPAAGNIFNNLGLLYKAMGDYPRALECCQKALAIDEKVYGEEHPSTATSYNNLGLVNYAMGDYPQALEHHQKALSIREKVYGEEHPDTVTSYNNLGAVYKAMGNYPQAQEHYQKALTIKQKVYGEEHPDTATGYNNLGAVYKAMGDYPQALEHYQKALTIKQKVYGGEHTSTATGYNNLGSVYKAMGNHPRALEHFQMALAIKKKVYGREHPSTATSYNNLGAEYKAMGNHLQALEHFRMALLIREKVYGEEHPKTATSYNNLGVLCYNMGEYYKALEYMQKALKIREKLLSAEHPYTKNSCKWLKAIEAKLK